MLQHDCARPVIIAIAITGRPTQSKAIKVRVRPYNPTPMGQSTVVRHDDARIGIS